MRLIGKTAIVTGGGMGIGRACALAYSVEGAHVVVGDINAGAGQSTVDEIQALGGDGRFVALDVADPEACRELVDATLERYGRLDVMHANAGVELCKAIIDTTDDDWRRVLAVNLDGVFYCCREALRTMIEQGNGGSIIVTSSPLALATTRDIGAYTASKGGIIALMRAISLEGAPSSVRANALLPGATDTPMIRREIKESNDPDAMLQRWAESVPLGRLAQSDDIAKAAVFLASDDSSFITGTCVAVDGGMLATLNTGPVLAYTA